MSSQNQQPAQGPPYLPHGAVLGLIPSHLPDIAISSVLVVIFVLSAAFNMTILQLNLRRKHKFLLSGLLFGFSMARMMANILRIAWAAHNDNARLVIAASIFANAGVLLLFVVNLILLQRIIRAYHPTVGWSRSLGWTFRALYSCVVACLVMVVISVVYSYYTTDPRIQSQLRTIRLTAAVFLAVLSFLPIPGVTTVVLLPRTSSIDRFGSGSMRTKIILLLFTATLLSFGACFRAAGAFIQRPAENPGWFNSKAAYYCSNYLIELTVVGSYSLSRFDRRFLVPDGSCAPGHYSRGGPSMSSGRMDSADEKNG